MVFILEFLGTVAFAISGASTGVQKKMDIFGVSMLAMTTAVGGGILRDIILNVTPPAAFRKAAGGVTFRIISLRIPPPTAVVIASIDTPKISIFF